jgi:iron(III) transport system permease protein
MDLTADHRAALATPRAGRSAWALRAAMLVVLASLTIAIVLPLGFFLAKSLQSADYRFAGFANFIRYFTSPGLVNSIGNSFLAAGLSTAISVGLAFIYAYGLTRSCLPWKNAFRVIAFFPMFAPSLLPAISLVYFFGTQGVIKGALMGHEIYGPIGIVMGLAFYTFPHAFIIILTALSLSDARLYEASICLRANTLKTFWMVILPGARYGVISAAFVAFALAITDFGVPKVLGGKFTMLATDIYSNVVGVQDMEMAAVVGVVLLLPAAIAFVCDRVMQRKQMAVLSARAVPYNPKPSRGFDLAMFAACGLIALVILGVLLMAAYASLVTFWPYNLRLTFANYDFAATTERGWHAYQVSLKMSACVALLGTLVVFGGAYLVEKTRAFPLARWAIHLLAMIPMAVPGMVLGLAYIFFFNHPANPIGFLYGTLAILVLVTITHFYTVGHLTAVTALRQLDDEFESVSASLKVPVYKTLWRVTVPVCLPAILNVAVYLFINSMTTVSALVFLYVPATMTASIQMLFQDDNGKLGSALALGMVIFLTSLGVRILYWLFTRGLNRRSQAWRQV